ncbi:unnamed protein product [Notodromas monacha]|uniref:C2H2-type domain-containing protein n=1 Tax=Notodromas monacha TaxID=399045 RepID=A0A7R9GFA2_9CRUS|nr:unnamed protein product [Notodromas monacha]CAG0918921.1 unnamed protein product [Notodromas monacha]
MSDKTGLTRKPGRRTLLKAHARPRREPIPKDSSPKESVPSSKGDDIVCDTAERSTSASQEACDDEPEEGSTTASEEEEPEAGPSLDDAPGPSGISQAVIKPREPDTPLVDPKLREQQILGTKESEQLTPEQKTDLLITNCKSLGDNQHECCICKKKIRGGLTHLRMHMRTHTGHRPYKCDLCGAQFVQRAQLRAHSICHSELRPFACEICRKRFKRAESVKDHMKVHTGEKPFKCSYCERWFGHKCDVVKHERVHTGEKPYSCQHCGRAFSQKGALRVHIRTHTKERPYRCPHKSCDKAFPILSSLQRHLCKHSGTKPFTCEVCSVSFFTQTHLKRHQKTHFEQGEGSQEESIPSQPTPPLLPLAPAAPPVSMALPTPELKCEKCLRTFLHHASWQRHAAICGTEQVADQPAELVTVPPPAHQPTITSVFHPKKFRRALHPPPLMKFRSKQGDEIEVGLVQKSAATSLSSTSSEVEVAAAEVTIEPKDPMQSSSVVVVEESELVDVAAPGPSGVSAPEAGTVVFLNREVTIRKLPSKN